MNADEGAMGGYGPGRFCSSRHRIPINPKDEGSTSVTITTTWRAIHLGGMLAATGLADIARRVLGHQLPQRKRVQHACP